MTLHLVKISRHEHDINKNSSVNFGLISFCFVTCFCVISKIATLNMKSIYSQKKKKTQSES